MPFSVLSTIIFSFISTPLTANDLICPSYPPTCDLDKSVFNEVLDEIDNYIESNVIAENNITGFITTIVYDQQVLFSKGYGLRNYMNKSSGVPTGDDLVMIASNTKIFTALLTYYLRDSEKYDLSLDDPVTKYLPSFSVKSIYNTNKEISLIELLSHTSGLQDETPYPYNDVSNNETAILAALSKKYLLFPSKSQFHYSNLGYALLGRSIEKMFCPENGGCYEYYVKKLILDGLNFSEYSGFNYSQFIIDNYCAYGWYFGENNSSNISNSSNSDEHKEQGPIETFHWNNPNGAMLASPNDMAKFIMFMFRNDMNVSSRNDQLLDGVTINEMLESKTLLNDGKEAVGTPFEMHYHEFETLHNYNHNSMSGVWFKGKQGEVLGYRSCTMMIPDYKLGVFTVALEDPDFISDGSVWANDILDILLPFVDNLLYENYYKNIEYFVPSNWKLLSGSYKIGDDIVNIELTKDEISGKEYLLFDDVGSDQHNIQLFDQSIPDVFRLGNDVEITQDTCFWGEIPQTNELLYFNFDNGTDNHATSFLYDEDLYVYV